MLLTELRDIDVLAISINEVEKWKPESCPFRLC